jgi:hypothetical protein
MITRSQGCRLGRRSPYARPRSQTVATRYDKLAVRYEATIHIAAVNEWLCPYLLNTA